MESQVYKEACFLITFRWFFGSLTPKLPVWRYVIRFKFFSFCKANWKYISCSSTDGRKLKRMYITMIVQYTGNNFAKMVRLRRKEKKNQENTPIVTTSLKMNNGDPKQWLNLFGRCFDNPILKDHTVYKDILKKLRAPLIFRGRWRGCPETPRYALKVFRLFFPMARQIPS